MTKIFIDPGHGGSDPGAMGHGLREKDLTLTIALKLREILNDRFAGQTVKLSRTKDATVSLTQRTNMANQWSADYLISIHINAGGGTGFESYIYNGNYARKGKTNRLRSTIHKEIIRNVDFRNRGSKAANFHVLRESNMSAMLTENGFIDHYEDARKLKQDEFLNEIAHAHAVGLATALNLKEKSIEAGLSTSSYRIKKGDTLWSLAQRNKTTVNKLKEINPGIIPKKLQIGQHIRLK